MSVQTQTAAAALELLVVTDQTVSYAAYQNNVPLIREITLHNQGSEPLADLVLRVQFEPAFAEPLLLRFEKLEAGETRRLGPVDVSFRHQYLAELNEAERGRVVAEVSQSGAAEEPAAPLAQSTNPIEVLAYDQWAGTRAVPELLAAFSLPNDPAVDRLAHAAGELISRSGKGNSGASMNGYQSKNREAVWAQLSALYSAVVALNLHYNEAPASFGGDGQKIRTPDRISAGGVANCLDLTMLLCSALEQAGLNPVVLVKRGHAWLGCWLINTTLGTAIFDDCQAVRKRVGTGELIVFETTLLAQRPVGSLRAACEQGQAQLQDERDFLFALDVKRARLEQVRPLPSCAQATQVQSAPAPAAAPEIEAPPALPPLDTEAVLLDEDPRVETPAGRLDRWKAKLLDLTLRNRLINFKATRVMLPLRVPDPAQLEDALAEGREWRFRAMPELMETPQDPRSLDVATKRNREDPRDSAARQAMAQHELLAPVESKKLDAHLYEIYSAARLGLEEGGANTLFLALGFLRWAEDERAEKTYMAPLFLVPVTLTRKSVRTGYAITRHDDEAIVNPTLMELLKRNFQLTLKGLDPLPMDERGVDLARIWQIFRQAVKEVPRWEVIEDVYLGIFSFTKFLMWRDLQDRAEQLKQNAVVRHLIERPSEAIGGDRPREDMRDIRDLDARHPPASLLTPLLADSSQLNAVSRAAAGHDYALEGPPGTGKSQTITNLIANALGQGKSVLFVSEKMAALDVVQRRLNSIGLGPFCLELHSAKSNKAEVLRQFRLAMDAAGEMGVAEWQREADKLAVLRGQLNTLVEALHHVHRNGLTVYGATSTAIAHRAWPPAPLTWADADLHDEAGLEAIRDLARAMAAVGGELPTLSQHPLGAIGHTEWSNEWEDRLIAQAGELKQSAAQLPLLAAELAPLLGIDLSTASYAQLEAADALADALLLAAPVPGGLAAQACDAGVRTRLQTLQAHGKKRNEHWNALAPHFKPEIARANGDELAAAWMAAEASWWPMSWFARRAVGTRFLPYTLDAQRPPRERIAQALPQLQALNVEDAALKSREAEAAALLETEYQGIATDWSRVEGHARWAATFAEAVDGMLATGADPALKAQWIKLLAEQRYLLGAQGKLAPLLAQYRALWAALKTQAQGLSEHAGAALIVDAQAPGLAARFTAITSNWINARRSLRHWCAWRRLRAQAVGLGLEGFVAALEQGSVPLREAAPFMEYSYCSWWLKRAIDREPVLRLFSSADHERKIMEFRNADARFQKLTERYITAVLAAKVPQQAAGQRPDKELALVLHELAKQRAHIPVRKLVRGIPTLLPKLKPCLLMSPLSVAQYLDAAHSAFDLVIFDEASQIPVWDAVGAIARGKQLVVVGDPKQLPPTSFFATSSDGEESLDNAEDAPRQDLESILDECLGAGLPTLSLDWHYRSRHESLITFSNQRYYDARLITFPSPVTNDAGVQFIHVPGVYDRGSTRTNSAEAAAIVKEIVAHFLDDARSRLTMGVVTFNQTQQKLIEKQLDAELARAPELERRIAAHGPERLFIKNLENVQGDERDIILFSITYGKDAAGKMAMNFGPLNQEGGHRRLNVAITRARSSVRIYSSIRPEDIDLSRTRASGVTDLKNYLEFAIRGAQAITAQSLPTGREPDSPFERLVIAALRDKGWTVHPQVGCSGYRLDMAVVHPEEPGRYLCGIECDGATYHSLPTARDRDRLRQYVLEGLGWHIHRIWSTDWWTDAEREVARVDSVLRLVLHEEKEERQEKAAAAAKKAEEGKPAT